MSGDSTTHPAASRVSPLDLVCGTIRNRVIATVVVAVLLPVAFVAIADSMREPVGQGRGTLVMVGAASVALCIAVALALYVARPWVSQASSIKGTLDAIILGDRQARAEIVSNDEWGAIALTLNKAMLSSQGAHRIQDSLRRIAKGDLTRAKLEGDSADAIVESINSAIEQLCRIVSGVQAVSLEVGTSVHEIQGNAEGLRKESEFHAAQINDTSAAVDEIVESIREVAAKTSACARIAEEAQQSAITGSEAVSNTMRSMERIRNQVQSNAQSFKELGESSQEIGEIVKLISDVAERTSLLALNASIQAAMAGDAGQGFGVVAEEVERLSQRCNDATKQITKLVKSTQSETSKAIAGMEQSITEVVEGSKLARQAGDALRGIDAVSNRLAEVINSISVAANQQVRGGVLASRSISEISAVMHENAVGSKLTVQAVRRRATLTDKLCSSIRQFKMPEESDRMAADASTATDPLLDDVPEAAGLIEAELGELCTSGLTESSTIG